MRRVAYHYNPGVGQYHYGDTHPMKPIRIEMAHSLIYDYGLLDKMTCYGSARATMADMCDFHSSDYIQFLRNYTLEQAEQMTSLFTRYNVSGDTPVFSGLFDFCSTYTGASLAAAATLVNNECDIAINWSGGLHHARKSKASGFCYVNDIVLAILRLLQCVNRVMYIDIDVHHGDGVQEAFYLTDRVLTLSLHQYGNDFFPCTGLPSEEGIGGGLGYSINVPILQGIDDNMYHSIFKPIVGETVRTYQPDCIVLQCGADSLNGDRLGCFNLSIKGHAECVRYVRSLNVPMLVLGGGGYTPRNVARCWAYETSVLLDVEVPEKIPEGNVFYDAYHPAYTLCPPIEKPYPNMNTAEYMNLLRQWVFESLRRLPAAPSVGIANETIAFCKPLIFDE